MSEPLTQGEVLSREELDALLNELERSRHEDDEHRRLFPASPGADPSIPFAPLERCLEEFAGEYAKTLSSLYQKRIDWEIIGWEVIPLAELAEALLPQDRVVVFASEPSGDPGYVVISRPIFFDWMCLAYGGRTGLRANPVPERPYTRIERRFLKRVVSEMLGEVTRFASDLTPMQVRVIGVDEPRVLLEGTESGLLVSFDVRGFGSFGRVRLVLPTGPLKRLEGPPRRTEPRPRHPIRDALLDMRVPVRVEAGTTDLPLARLARLQPGETVFLDGPEDGTLVVRVGGAGKFRAVRGTVGRRLAVQIVERTGG